MVSGIPLILGLGTRMSDPYVYVVFRAPRLKVLGFFTEGPELPIRLSQGQQFRLESEPPARFEGYSTE